MPEIACFPQISADRKDWHGLCIVSAEPAALADGFSREAMMFNDFARIAAAAISSLMLTTIAVGAAIDGHAAAAVAGAAYASADSGETANV
jgi:hypothetical protein